MKKKNAKSAPSACKAKLVGVEIKVLVEVPNIEAAAAVKSLYDVATRAVAHQGWGGGSFEVSLVYDGVNKVADAPVAHDSRLN